MPSYSDKELVKKFKNDKDKNESFTLILNKYKEKVYWHIRKLLLIHEDTDDVTQNTFIKIYKNLNNFRNESELYTWIYRIATNEAITFLRQKKKRGIFSNIDSEKLIIQNLKSDEYFEGDELQLKLQKILTQLPEKQRLVFNMKYYDDMKYEQISKILKTSVGALKASYHHAIKKIEKYLKNN